MCLSPVLDGIPNDFVTSRYIFQSNSSGRVSKNCEVSSFLDGGVPASDGKTMDTEKVGKQIALLRKNKKLTQSELGERIGVSFQAVSKWERGETLPDVTLLPDLAKILETTIDFILLGGENITE